MKTTSDLLKLIGNTPLVKLKSLSSETDCNIFAKLEFYNPGGSVKDRVAQYLVRDAECRGLLKPGDTIVEATSGNMGVAFALLSAVKKYKCIFTLPESITREKIQALFPAIFGESCKSIHIACDIEFRTDDHPGFVRKCDIV